MKIKTKFSMGDSAFVMYNDKAVPIKIMGVYYSLDVYKGGHIAYACGNFKWKYKNEN